MHSIAMLGLEVKLSKLLLQDDIEVYLKTLERVMGAYKVKET